jgi:hypothetical protein
MSQAILFFALLGFLIPRVSADVVITRLEPPLSVGVPWSFISDIKAIDFNHDGQTDMYLSWDTMYMSVSFFAPNRVFIRKDPPTSPGQTNVSGIVGALSFGTVIGSNVVSAFNLTNYAWHSGDVIPAGNGTEFGNRGNAGGYVADSHVVGQPPIIAGDVVGRDGVMAFQFHVNGQPHFGYVHFDFRPQNGWLTGSGFGGYIRGFAYETVAGAPIVAQRLDGAITTDDGKITGFVQLLNRSFLLTCNTVAGGTYQVQMSGDLAAWNPVGVPVQAEGNSLSFTLPAVEPSPSQAFYRIRRSN